LSSGRAGSALIFGKSRATTAGNTKLSLGEAAWAGLCALCAASSAHGEMNRVRKGVGRVMPVG